jgi:hypothetical protein
MNASPHQLIVMLFDGAHSALVRAPEFLLYCLRKPYFQHLEAQDVAVLLHKDTGCVYNYHLHLSVKNFQWF